ncbi:hypothetical protein CC79DRAFT_1185233 [Sarocladium strictum]
MVGVKGRSKACRTCLRRKKGVSQSTQCSHIGTCRLLLPDLESPRSICCCRKGVLFSQWATLTKVIQQCGQQRPACEQCIKARIPCGGYATELIIIEHDPHSRSPESSTYAIDHAHKQAISVVKSLSDNRHTHRSPTHRSRKRGGSSRPGDVVITGGTPKYLSRAAEEAKICGQFWSMFLPNRRALPLDMIRDKMGGWINAVQDLHSTDPVLRKTMLALSLTTLGKANDDEAMVREGTMLYGKALGELSAAPSFARKAGVDTMLSAIRLFGVYEVC